MAASSIQEDLTELVRKELNGLTGLPVPVADWQIEEGYDATGDHAVWVWAILDDGELESAKRSDIETIREMVREAVTRASPAPVPWAYVRFRATSEV